MLKAFCFAYLDNIAHANDLQTRSSCSTFTAAESSYTKPGDQTFIVSRGITCTGIKDCYVDVAGYATDTRTINITIDDTASIFSLISDTSNITFAETFTGNITSQPWPITNGTSGYVGFTPIHRCISGELFGCDGDAGLNFTWVEACTPYSIVNVKDSNGFTSMHGTLHEITTTQEEAAALTCDPANSTAAVSGITVTSCSDAAATTAPTTSAGLKFVAVDLIGLVVGCCIVGVFNSDFLY